MNHPEVRATSLAAIAVLGLITAATIPMSTAVASSTAGGDDGGYLNCPSQYIVAAKVTGAGHLYVNAAGYSNSTYSEPDQTTIYTFSVSRSGYWQPSADVYYNGFQSGGFCEHV